MQWDLVGFELKMKNFMCFWMSNNFILSHSLSKKSWNKSKASLSPSLSQISSSSSSDKLLAALNVFLQTISDKVERFGETSKVPPSVASVSWKDPRWMSIWPKANHAGCFRSPPFTEDNLFMMMLFHYIASPTTDYTLVQLKHEYKDRQEKIMIIKKQR